ncbi:3-oxoacyl-[acyl-carrier protein] reductase [Serratia fonticola]|jgi:3-oxoacyl-[acyl-carrier protein] reductase|uniref:3-oxoacyl-[acyl-carrier protein] reductase n=1 Tax=Serratia fonticola TaxID=47917 RepID=A0A542BRQ3_SERFO|nr:3-oxoacyl-ACP reductase family protein [Serratia fonticola]TQI81261.1 3-oxoacyl-[acyl-carrier protein] reductase [Serratia fonticola]TQI96715.1 3-oxoacyl-[acyl-carrier protein] reductase [Serratia fonticola]TVZ71211.1 3-oxoacyl-[acyl-carrier protein] reductase [Serratia fonticola]
MPTLSGKVALVTGGSRGIGADIARRLARDGADVIITYMHNVQAAEKVLTDIHRYGQRGESIQADVADAATIAPVFEQVMKRYGSLDILVNNAGYMDISGTPLSDIPLETVDQTIMVNIRGAYLYAQHAASYLQKGGRIINIGSCVGRHVPGGGLTLYAMSKSAIIGLTKGLARDLGTKGITVNQISPGPIETDMNPENGPNAEFWRNLTSLGRYGTTKEVAAVASFLASSEAAFITGAEIAVDGGINS